MKTKTLLSSVAVAGVIFLATDVVSVANAAQGCGFGYHRVYNGRCVVNRPGAYARPAPLHPGCWRNWRGQLRCYR